MIDPKSYVRLVIDRGDGAPADVAVNVDPRRLHILAAMATLSGMAFDVTISRIAMYPIPTEELSEAERITLEALYASIRDYFPVVG